MLRLCGHARQFGLGALALCLILLFSCGLAVAQDQLAGARLANAALREPASGVAPVRVPAPAMLPILPPIKPRPEPAKTADEAGDISTDRPDYTDSTDTVAPGILQIENGFTLTGDHGTRNLTGGEVLMRIGLNKRIELRLGSDGYDAQWGRNQSLQRGLADTALAMKIRVVDQRRYLPSFALIPILNLPTGSHLFTSSSFDPTMKLAWAKDLPHGFGVGGSLIYARLTNDGAHSHQWDQSVSVSHGLPRGFDGFWEVYSIGPWEPHGTTAWIGDTGVAHKLGHNAQIDVRIGRRMTGSGPDWFFGFGFAVRRPLLGVIHSAWQHSAAPRL